MHTVVVAMVKQVESFVYLISLGGERQCGRHRAINQIGSLKIDPDSQQRSDRLNAFDRRRKKRPAESFHWSFFGLWTRFIGRSRTCKKDPKKRSDGWI
ncbi:hypothetical protein BDP81DRAFT_144651 [Colletotrichum phormii]|uniref:Uncharacterized protein n=1 Tax=Colletotrichum phormii TaxID=359342 RepID=A0AAJ0E9B4_9PEZI|nr:uncharacterized protein BDP81DRAFT_144651 [Colletotrichum phormii]KAK1622605.1 hypothetical protein BDP81DRAFT_144651 [Colletotrichum phormii]